MQCGNHGCPDVSGRGNRGAHLKEKTLFLLTPRSPTPSLRGRSLGRTLGPPSGTGPRLQAFGEEAFLQQECPPKSTGVNQPWPPSG